MSVSFHAVLLSFWHGLLKLKLWCREWWLQGWRCQQPHFLRSPPIPLGTRRSHLESIWVLSLRSSESWKPTVTSVKKWRPTSRRADFLITQITGSITILLYFTSSVHMKQDPLNKGKSIDSQECTMKGIKTQGFLFIHSSGDLALQPPHLGGCGDEQERPNSCLHGTHILVEGTGT